MTRRTSSLHLAAGLLLLAVLTLVLLACGNHAVFAAGTIGTPAEAPPTYRWRQVNTGLEDPWAMWFSSNFAANGQVYAFFDYTTLGPGYGYGGYGAILRSNTRGRTWSFYGAAPPLFKLTAVSPETPTGPVLLGVEEYFNEAEGDWRYRLLRSTSATGGWTTVWDKSPLFS